MSSNITSNSNDSTSPNRRNLKRPIVIGDFLRNRSAKRVQQTDPLADFTVIDTSIVPGSPLKAVLVLNDLIEKKDPTKTFLPTCSVCLMSQANTICNPCLHICLCTDCKDKHLKRSNLCPVCMNNCHTIAKFYLA